MANALRPQMTRATSTIVRQVQDAVPAHAGRAGTRRHRLLIAASRAAAQVFLDGASRQPERAHQVDEIFRGLGYAQGRRGGSRESIDTAMHTATQCSWRYLADFAVDHDLSGAALRELADTLFDFLAHLHRLLGEGFDLAQEARGRDPGTARVRLFRLLRDTRPRARPGPDQRLDDRELRDLAELARWPLPERVVALAIAHRRDPPVIPTRREVLVHVQPRSVLVLCPEESQATVVEQISRSDSGARIARSWPVAVTEAGSALRWCQRALDLTRAGVIAPRPVIDCADHATQLWLHAEPSLRRHLCQQVLRPLLTEPATSRTILSETLLAWAETRGSASALATELGVHPQTVRYRWRRINELLGDSLRDPDIVLQMTLVLKSSVALWKTGEQCDFDLTYRLT
ncbi:helix-turn-helix domain-containing protein [Nocardioides sp. L-11A]|uniref:PucR family transcriptional regulator n=1 Tax=Nocardioides sp. L-11A TaxID=3043848 RepID=UPI00249BF381|nr:helix-turn-helix domain-containing protein [Nocardioides sp. L-11A]